MKRCPHCRKPLTRSESYSTRSERTSWLPGRRFTAWEEEGPDIITFHCAKHGDVTAELEDAPGVFIDRDADTPKRVHRPEPRIIRYGRGPDDP